MTRRLGGARGWEPAVSLAMLPAGVTLGLVSALAVPGFLLAAMLFLANGARAVPVCWAPAAAVLARCVRVAIEAAGGLDWRVGARAVAGWGLVAAGWPGNRS